MADQKLTALSENTSPVASDITYLVDDPGGTPASNKITLANILSLQPQTNLLINGNFDVWERGTTFTTPNDDTYTADRWNNVQETNADWTFARDTDAPDGSFYSIKLTCVTANAGVGIVTFLENKDTIPLDDKTVSMSFWAKTNSTEIANLRAGIITWGSTADSLTSDVVGTWHSSAGTNPTLATNWTYENTPANFSLTSSWQQFKVENVAIDTATVNNLGVFIWVDDVDASANDDVYIAQVQLNLGTEAGAFQPRPYAQELALCQRYYANVVDNVNMLGYSAVFVGTNESYSVIKVPTPLRTAPTATISGIVTRYGGSDFGWTSISVVSPSITAGHVHLTATTTGTTNGNAGITYALPGTIKFDAEL